MKLNRNTAGPQPFLNINETLEATQFKITLVTPTFSVISIRFSLVSSIPESLITVPESRNLAIRLEKRFSRLKICAEKEHRLKMEIEILIFLDVEE
ncbi:putative methylthioribulose-1-phosphate dehydratase [Dirofilaria immitis]